jgi:hypothetical protein
MQGQGHLLNHPSVGDGSWKRKMVFFKKGSKKVIHLSLTFKFADRALGENLVKLSILQKTLV